MGTFFANRRCLVTGGAGFIGSHIVDALLAAGARVRVLDNLSTGKRENLPAEVELIVGDIRNTQACARACVGIDTVFHCAAIPLVLRSFEQPELTRAVNVDGTMNVLTAASGGKFVRRFVLSSSCAVYGPIMPAGGHSEQDTPAPNSPYGNQKLECERRVSSFNKHGVIHGVSLRYFNVYGPRATAGVVNEFAVRLLKKQPLAICGDGLQVRDFVYVSDVVRANLLAASHLPGGTVLNVGTGIGTTINGLARYLATIAKVPLRTKRCAVRPGDTVAAVAATRVTQQAGLIAKVPMSTGLQHVLRAMRGTA